MVFSRSWFQQHQSRLLWWLNSRLTRRWFRWVLCIRHCDVGYRRPIVALYPHAYVALNETGAPLTADIRSYDKFARRLYFAFRPLWWTLHAWDWLVADRLVPRWSFGLDTLTTYGLGSPKHGHVSRDVASQTWDAAHDGVGNTLFIGEEWEEFNSKIAYLSNDNISPRTWQFIRRFLVSFDTSLLGVGASVSGGALSLYGDEQEVYDPGAITPTVDIFRVTPGNPSAFVATDFNECGDEAQSTTGGLNASEWNINGYNVFTLNALGLAHINNSGLTPWSVREATYEAPDIQPTTTDPDEYASAYFSAFMPNYPGTTKDPKLGITYVPAVSSYATQVDIYQSAGESVWTKPAGARWVEIHLVAGGGGGGSGRKDVTGTVRNGGGGGGAGTHCALRLPASVLGTTETITIGAGGNGGSAQSISGDGQPGASGQPTTFGTLAKAIGGGGGEGGNTGLTNGGDGYRSFPSLASDDEGDGGICADDAGRAPAVSAIRAGGGGGGAINEADVAHVGGDGGTVGSEALSGYGGTIDGGAGGAADGSAGDSGSDAPLHSGFGGGGGGGGGAFAAGYGGWGGGGGAPGGGGGGGGAVTEVGNSGAGGAGGDGLAIIVTYF